MAVTAYVAILLVGLITVQASVVKRQVGLDPETKKNCPREWDFSPCICQDMDSKKASIFCDNVTSGEDIKQAFAKLKESVSFATFFIKDSPLKSLPANAFGKASFEMFFITNTNLSSVDDNAFSGSEHTAETFLLYRNGFELFNFKSLQQLVQLQNFELSSDSLRSIPDKAFGEKANLQLVSFTGNKISSLGKNVFAKLPKLSSINLAKNNLRELKESSLTTSAAENPVSVLLSHNSISTVHKDAFKDLKVQMMDLEDNKLEKLDMDIFKPIVDSVVKNGGTLSTFGNPFECNRASVAWIVDLPPQAKSKVVGYTCRDGRKMEELQSSQLQY